MFFYYTTCHEDFYLTFAWNATDWIGKRKLPHDGCGKPFDLYTEDNTKIDEDFFTRIGDDIIVRLSTGTETIISVGNVNISWNELFLHKNWLEHCQMIKKNSNCLKYEVLHFVSMKITQ